ncbi:TIGR00297 family protein [Methanoculleus sp. FWC-SCC1]|uniref:TIGR00297 family protein n=1 Tax=Methanoculleus frigidifontis TaxID=2584085 RepID=A0ABT8M7Q0_9EURY|nr:TIGR00297 family protein [Methanoculleus sp. FWC-SCC1]MDN7023966.1 TIGR00297 family protein [Methanoculleus sp. FWC-SCC1]
MTRLPGLVLASVLTIAFIVLAPLLQPPWVLSLLIIPFSLVLFLIRDTRYASISIIALAVLYGLGLLSLFVFAATLAIVVVGELAFRMSGGCQKSYLYHIAAAAAASIPVMAYLGRFSPLIVLMGLLVAVLLRAALRERDDALMIEALGVAMTMALFEEINFQVDITLLLAAAIIAFSFGYFSYRLRVADVSGLFSGALIGVILIVFADVRWFLIMLTFFIIGAAATRYRYDYKASIGVAESHGGVRGYFNVFANGLVGTAASVLYGVTGEPAFIALFLGSVASAASDTVASEIGMTGGTPYLITTFRPVPRGTNGGVTLRGEVAAVAAAIAVAAAAYGMGIADLWMVAVTILAGFIGTNVDSLVGATLENRGVFGNSGTNLTATFFGGVAAMGVYLLA